MRVLFECFFVLGSFIFGGIGIWWDGYFKGWIYGLLLLDSFGVDVGWMELVVGGGIEFDTMMEFLYNSLNEFFMEFVD